MLSQLAITFAATSRYLDRREYINFERKAGEMNI
jgi:hypothetical protein